MLEEQRGIGRNKMEFEDWLTVRVHSEGLKACHYTTSEIRRTER